ncbi:hypothetical protein [Aquabacterium sp. OR-4]|uniref:hypothetical protein n=1 Tax=Aquabacterium sp. OR-4 TaxID=2978127 RepID=UPI0028C88B48|nr:hypothetical protein [Aquabacterium sp. OR-4]MDT7837590.1 hypothetical protein [Aquabacterium sp. OR-4]
MSLLVWAAVGVSALVWGLKFWGRGTPVPPGASVAQLAPPAGMDLSRVLGTPPPQPVDAPAPVVADSRFRLLGVAAPRAGQSGGLALIAVDGKPPRTWLVGREVEPGLRLLAVSHRRAELGVPGTPPSVTLELPMLAMAQRGRPGEVPGAMPGAMPGVMPPGALPGQPGQIGAMPGAPMGAMPAVQAVPPGLPAVNGLLRAPGAVASPAQLAVPGAPVVVGEPAANEHDHPTQQR